jgi:hypothetical protein
MEIVPTENVGRVQPFQTLFNLNLQLLTGLRETAKYLQIRASRSNHGLGSWAELKPSLLCRFRSEAIFSTRKGPPGTNGARLLLTERSIVLGCTAWMKLSS